MLFLKQLIVYQSFYGALLVFSFLVFFSRKVLCFARVGTSFSRCLFLKRSKDLVDKIMITYIILCTYIIYIHMKGCGQERPLEFLAIFKVLKKVAEIWRVGFVLPEKHFSEVCFAGSLFVV